MASFLYCSSHNYDSKAALNGGGKSKERVIVMVGRAIAIMRDKKKKTKSKAITSQGATEKS